MLDDEDRQHYEGLLKLHREYLRRLEIKAATFGPLQTPNHIEHERPGRP